jgi:hypothetical protein
MGRGILTEEDLTPEEAKVLHWWRGIPLQQQKDLMEVFREIAREELLA